MSGKNKKRTNTSYNWNSGGFLTNNLNSIEFLKANGVVNQQNENSAKLLVPASGSLTNLIVRLENDVTNIDRRFSVHINGKETELNVIVARGENIAYTNIKIDVDKFDLISLSHRPLELLGNNVVAIANVTLESD